MAREHETSAQPWGTLEELLLVSAVNRHGTKSWDSVAMEVQSRSSSAVLTAQNCRDKFDDLKRRFVSQNDTKSHGLAPMVDELRRLRVEELRSEVRRRDVSIVSLELKVKRLEEDRDRSLKEEAEAGPTKDLQRGGGEQSVKPEKLTGKSNSGEDFVSDSSERENRSFNESNSTSQRSEVKTNGVEEKKALEEEEPDPERNESDPVRTEIRSEPERDCSANGKVIDDDKEDNENNNKKKAGVEEAGRPGESNELSGSLFESKRVVVKEGGVPSKQNSDVQSSASLSKKRKRRRKGGDSSSGEEPEGEENSPATTKRVKLVKLEPLVKVLTIIRSHRLGSVFERRLRSQESQRYKSLIRQHVDLHVVQSRLDKGVYKDCTHNFFRDLLLVFNNAVVFFRKTTPEHVAALELRSLVLKEMNEHLPKSPPVVSTVKPKPNKESDITTTTTTSTSGRPSKSSSIVVCGKRGSINALSEGGNNNKKGGVRKERVEVEEKEAKVKVNEKKVDDTPLVKTEDKGVRKRRTQERRGGRRSRTTTSNSKNVESKTKLEHGGNELSSHDGLEVVKTEKKEEVKKRQGAASFLRRMKQNGRGGVGRANNSSVVSEDESKDSMVEEEEDEDDMKKKKAGRKKAEVERKVRVTRSSSGNRGRRGGRGQESGGRAKRGVGRPPKRSDTAAAGRGKRGKDNGEADQVGSAGRPRKRTRR